MRTAQRWVMIAVESYGSTSLLGEVWYAEADTPLGPWVYARKIVTHDKYSFYNPKQHPMFDKDGGRIIFFEGTYTTTFSGNPDPTPRYDYNQIMYQLDLSDPRLALPVAIYEDSVGLRAPPPRLVTKASPADREATPPRPVAFFAPDRPGIALAAGLRAIRRHARSILATSCRRPATGRCRRSGRCSSSFPPTSKTTPRRRSPCTNTATKGAGGDSIRSRPPSPNARSRLTPKLLGRVWRNPAASAALVTGECRARCGARATVLEIAGRNAMDSPVPVDPDDSPDCDLAERPARIHERAADERDQSWLSEIADQLESDPQECWHAVESLMSVEAELRLSIIDEMAALGSRPGAQMLLRLLSSDADDPATRAAARSALVRVEDEAFSPCQPVTPTETTENPRPDGVREPVVAAHPLRGVNAFTRTSRRNWRAAWSRRWTARAADRSSSRSTRWTSDEPPRSCATCGWASATSWVEVEPESPEAGGLVDALDQLPGVRLRRDVPELALGLLAGSLMLCGPTVPAPVRDWLLGTLGPEFQPAGFPATIPGLDHASIPQAEMPERAAAVLDACPSWLDSVTANLRAGRGNLAPRGADGGRPDRDAGRTGFSSNTGSSTASNCTGACSCGWHGSGSSPARSNYRDRLWPWPVNSQTSNTPSRRIRLPSS